METIRLLVVDDHALFRRALANLLGNEPGFEVVGEAGDGAEAVSKAQALRPDLILMDIHMPGTDGLQATRQIVSALPATRVVILTVSEEDKDLFEAIKSGGARVPAEDGGARRAVRTAARRVPRGSSRVAHDGREDLEAVRAAGGERSRAAAGARISRHGRGKSSRTWPPASRTRRSGASSRSRRTP